jgi:hypothetical protein
MITTFEDYTGLTGVRSATAEQHARIREYVEKYMQLLGSTEAPSISLRDNLNPRWLGRTMWRSTEPKHTTVQLQRAILTDARTLERVIAHEVVHHVELTTLPAEEVACIQQGRCKHQSHAARFHELAAQINAVMGDGFVTVKSDESYVLAQQSKQYYLLIGRMHVDGRYAYAWSSGRLRSPRTMQWVERRRKEGAILATVSDPLWAARGPRFGEGMGIPPDAERQEQLREYYRQATEDNPHAEGYE